MEFFLKDGEQRKRRQQPGTYRSQSSPEMSAHCLSASSLHSSRLVSANLLTSPDTVKGQGSRSVTESLILLGGLRVRPRAKGQQLERLATQYPLPRLRGPVVRVSRGCRIEGSLWS